MPVTDQKIETIISVVLRTGVTLSGFVVLLGGIYYLERHGGDPVDYRVFQAQKLSSHYMNEIIQGALQGRGRSIIQLGVLCLIATPIMRVIVSLIGFALERDRTYVLITSLVLLILLYSLISGAPGAA
jgi:uncharacterized membrane protein